ncbi:hypothetical protein I3760_02G051300 [Carya illinoinensis]|nr:hypothetical protein I3760_02G051300 [Carya illinoinensis]
MLASSSSGLQPLCHDDERFALLQFKESFIINQSASKDASAYPKVSSWKPDQISDCCKWDGVECNKDTRHVIALDLSSSCLKGFLNSNSSLFRLAHLQNLNLADNDFNSSPVVISSNVPNILANLTSLTSLSLSNCDLHGEFPVGIFRLPNLQHLDIQYNENLTGCVPEFNRTSPLVSLKLGYTNFYGELPDSIGNLKSLVEFNAYFCNFSGEIPSSLGNLTNLIGLRLQSNRLQGSIPQSISRLVNLEVLYLHDNNLSGTVEFELFLRLRNLLQFLRNQDQLEALDLSGNKIHGQVPKWMGNVSIETLWALDLERNFLTGFNQLPVVLPYVNLNYLGLGSNMLQGSLPIPPPSIAYFSKLHIIDLSNNDLTGKLPSEHFLNWKAMQIVDAESLKYVEESHIMVTLAGERVSVATLTQ